MPPEPRLPGWLTGALLLALWETVGRLGLVASGALPAPSAILARLWIDRADYPAHVWATLQSSTLGFLAGNAIAIAAGAAFVLWPRLSRLARGLNIAIFALPPIAIAPILALTLEGIAPRVVLAALGVYFVTMSATVVGLTQVDTRAADLVRAYGGGRWAVLRLVQARGAVPAILAGFRVAAPNAVLGAILAEFGGGGRWGLGAYLLGSLGRGDPARLWGIGLVATLIAGLSYALFAAISARTPLLVLILGRGTAVTLWITFSVTFFPAYVLMAQGLALVPRATLDLHRAYGAGALTELRLVSIPASAPWIFAALRLTAPRALLGVMIAEWLATGRGLGNLLNQSRGYLDFAMIWTVATVSVLASVGFYQLVLLAERRTLARMAMTPAG